MKAKIGNLFIHKKYVKYRTLSIYRNLGYREFKYFLIYSSRNKFNWDDDKDIKIEYRGKVSVSTKPTHSSNHTFSYISEEQLLKEYQICVTEILKGL